MREAARGLREELRTFVRRFGLLNATSCEACCGQEVSLVQSYVLAAIRSLEGPSIQRVASELGIDLTTFSRQVKRLEAKGLVFRRPSPADRRASILGLTGEGARVLDRIDAFLGERIEGILSPMSPFERDVVVQSLQRLNAAMARGDGCCGPAPNSCMTQDDPDRENGR